MCKNQRFTLGRQRPYYSHVMKNTSNRDYRETDTDKELPWAQVSLLSRFLKGRKSFSLSAF